MQQANHFDIMKVCEQTNLVKYNKSYTKELKHKILKTNVNRTQHYNSNFYTKWKKQCKINKNKSWAKRRAYYNYKEIKIRKKIKLEAKRVNK